MEYRHQNLFGGQGEVTVSDLAAGVAPSPFTAVLACQLAPLGTVGPHSQAVDSEIVIVTSGEGQAQIDGVGHALSPGIILGLPLGSVLALANTSSEHPLAYLIVKATPKSA